MLLFLLNKQDLLFFAWKDLDDQILFHIVMLGSFFATFQGLNYLEAI